MKAGGQPFAAENILKRNVPQVYGIGDIAKPSKRTKCEDTAEKAAGLNRVKKDEGRCQRHGGKTAEIRRGGVFLEKHEAKAEHEPSADNDPAGHRIRARTTGVAGPETKEERDDTACQQRICSCIKPHVTTGDIVRVRP